MHFVSSVPPQSAVTGDTVTWNINSLASRTGGTINVTLKADAPPGMNINDVITLFGIIEPIAGDETPENNRDTLKQTVRGSFDPNDKAENLNGTLSPDQVGTKYLTYTIRFQNTGTDTAFNIIVRDTLDAKLDWPTFEMTGTSHKAHSVIKSGNVLSWTFTDILLPDSNVNEAASHGYITYRVKAKPSLVLNDTVRNSASIYFDFNPGVRTNIHETVVKAVLVPTPSVSGVASNYCSTQGLQKGKINNLPASGSGITTTAKLDGNALAIAADSTFSFDVSTLAAGQHSVVVTYANGSETKTSTNNFTITAAVTPDVNVSANSTTLINLLDPLTVTASNVAGGGSSPLYAFAKDRGFTNLWQAESASNVFNTTANSLNTGDNWIYVRMKTSSTCFTAQYNIDSIRITLNLPAPNAPVVTGIRNEYCSNEGVQKAKITNYPAAGTGTTVTVKLDGVAIPVVMTDTSFMFNPSTLAAGNHVADVTYANTSGTKTTTINFTISATVTPDVNLSANSTNVITTPAVITAANASGGGTAPLYTFASDRSFTRILQAESANASLSVNPSSLKLGDSKIYVRMKTSLSCYTAQTAIDSIVITKFGATGLVDPDFPGQTISANPNPFRDQLVVYGLNVSKSYTIILYNQQGHLISKTRVTGRTSQTWNVPALQSGAYMLRIYDETKKRVIGTIEVVKQ
jgi:hypothetical protein